MFGVQVLIRHHGLNDISLTHIVDGGALDAGRYRLLARGRNPDKRVTKVRRKSRWMSQSHTPIPKYGLEFRRTIRQIQSAFFGQL